MLVYFVTHPEVQVQPDVPVTQWGLSEQGRRRLHRLLVQPWLEPGTLVASSDERKALETAEAVAAVVDGARVLVEQGLGENDRSATGFLSPPQFEATANQFFAHPDASICGWERARDAQARVVGAVARVLAAATEQQCRTVVIVSHGGVGTLLQCALRGVPIDRCHDQEGQGSYFSFDGCTHQLHHGWRRI